MTLLRHITHRLLCLTDCRVSCNVIASCSLLKCMNAANFWHSVHSNRNLNAFCFPLCLPFEPFLLPYFKVCRFSTQSTHRAKRDSLLNRFMISCVSGMEAPGRINDPISLWQSLQRSVIPGVGSFRFIVIFSISLQLSKIKLGLKRLNLFYLVLSVFSLPISNEHLPPAAVNALSICSDSFLDASSFFSIPG